MSTDDTRARFFRLVDDSFSHADDFNAAAMTAEQYFANSTTGERGAEFTDKLLAAKGQVEQDRAEIIDCGNELAETLQPPLNADVFEIVSQFELEPAGDAPKAIREMWPKVRAQLLYGPDAKVLGLGDKVPPRPENTVKLKGRDQTDGWTVKNANACIEEFIAKHTTEFYELAEHVAANKPGADKAAHELFGRNALAKRFRMGKGTVSKTAAWARICANFGWGQQPPSKMRKRVGYEIALEESSEATSTSAGDVAEIEDIIRLAHAELPASEAKDIEDGLRRGIISVEDANNRIHTARVAGVINHARSVLKPEEASDIEKKLQRGDMTIKAAKKTIHLIKEQAADNKQKRSHTKD